MNYLFLDPQPMILPMKGWIIIGIFSMFLVFVLVLIVCFITRISRTKRRFDNIQDQTVNKSLLQVADATPQLNKIKSIKDVNRLKFPYHEKEYEFKMEDLIAKGVIGKFLYQGYTKKCGDYGDEAWRTFKKPGKFNNSSPCPCVSLCFLQK
jgi:hypothetical protein